MRRLAFVAAGIAATFAVGLSLAQEPRTGGAAPESTGRSPATRAVPARTATALPAADWRTLVGGPGPESIPVRAIEGAGWVAAADVAQLLDASKFWRGDLRKLELRTPAHRIVLTVDNPFVVIDDHTVRLGAAVRSIGGELFAPVALVDSLPRHATLARLYHDASRRVVLRVPASGIVTGPRLAVDPGITRLTFPVDRPDEVVIAGRDRAHFRVRFSGFYAGALPATFPEGSLVRAVRPIATAGGSAFEIEVVPEAAGFRMDSDIAGRRVTLSFETQVSAGLQAFAPEGPAGPRPIRVVVLDPGHGGTDAGVSVQGAIEKDLTLQLARLVKGELERRMSVRVVLTRDGDQVVTEAQRAERANQARADLLISLHFDGFPGSRARGATAYCPPATFVAPGRDPGLGGPIPLIPWRDVALRHAVAARELSEDVLSALELRSQGPTRLREILPHPMLGVNAPGLLLECATLTSDADRARVTAARGLADLAVTIAEGIEAWQRNE